MCLLRSSISAPLVLSVRLLIKQKGFKALQHGGVFGSQPALPALRAAGILVAEPQQIIGGHIIQPANGRQRVMAGIAFALLPAAHGIQGSVPLVGQNLLRLAVILENFL